MFCVYLFPIQERKNVSAERNVRSARPQKRYSVWRRAFPSGGKSTRTQNKPREKAVFLVRIFRFASASSDSCRGKLT